MVYLLLAVACSLAIGMIFKHAGRQGLDRVTLLTVNYAVAALGALALIALGAKRTAAGLAPSPGLLALGVGTGVLFIGGFFLLSLATDLAGMSIATGVMRVSVVIPFLASWLIWNETPTLTQGAGLACAGVAFFMITARRQEEKGERKNAGARSVATGASEASPATEPSRGREEVAAVAPPAASAAAAAPSTEGEGGANAPEAGSMRTFGVLVLLFVSGGLVDTCMKTFDEAFAEESSRALFLLMIFGVAFLVGAAEMVRRRAQLSTALLVWGAGLGVVNYGSVEFILRAIRALRGPFVFPANNISIVMGATLLGVWFWGEHLSTFNRAGLLVAALALFLLRP